MKNINYESLKGDEHVCKSWSLMPFKIDDNYEYISKNIIFNFFSTIILIPIAIILYFFNKIFLGFEIEGKENKIKDAITNNLPKNELRELVYTGEVVTLLQDGLNKVVEHFLFAAFRDDKVRMLLNVVLQPLLIL